MNTSTIHTLIGEGLASPAQAGVRLQQSLTYLAKSCLLYYAAGVSEKNPASVPLHPALQRALQLLESNPARFRSAPELAQQCGISTSRLRQLFRESGRESPSAMLWRLKGEYAIQMIRSTGLSLGEIADQSGFSNPFHLSRVVKNMTGTAPRELRRRQHSG